jgi:hypothetical protein
MMKLHLSETIQHLIFRAFKLCRIGKAPVVLALLAGEKRARFVGVVAYSYHDIDRLILELVQMLGRMI